MTRRFIARPLAPERIDEAFPVARAAVAGLTLERWQRFARQATTPTDAPAAVGILVVENCRGYIQGFCTYRLQHNIRHGTALVVDDLVAMDLIDGAPVAAALVEALEAQARSAGCEVLQLHVPDELHSNISPNGLYEYLRQAGHAVDAVRLRKPVDRLMR